MLLCWTETRNYYFTLGYIRLVLVPLS